MLEMQAAEKRKDAGRAPTVSVVMTPDDAPARRGTLTSAAKVADRPVGHRWPPRNIVFGPVDESGESGVQGRMP